VAAALARQLREWRDPGRAAAIQRYFKGAVVSLGIGTPRLRCLARQQVSRRRTSWQAEDAIDCCDRLLHEPELEVRMTGVVLLSGFQKTLTADLLPLAEGWLRERLDNWALVDVFCGSILTPLLAREPALARTLARWSRDHRLWVRRASLVTLVLPARRGDRLDLAYRLAREHFADPEDLMHKATGWLLREAGKTDPGRLREFLLRHGPAIPRTALRYAIERFPAAERARLLRATRTSG
jgi:3-methyladenine DNA glycosylase AlkD